MKYISLTSLTLQNALLALVMRYVRTRPGDLFMSTTAVIMSEVLKFVTCLVFIFIQEGSVSNWLRHLNENIIKQPIDCMKVSIPSLVYTLQNNLLYVAVSNLDAATYQEEKNIFQMSVVQLSLLIKMKKYKFW
ncbi:UDP-galactose translocator-like isoform X3 [Octopus vulgaris]|nr:UDP-galactose translocator-like isoform X3 [Octopus vulgaris]